MDHKVRYNSWSFITLVAVLVIMIVSSALASYARFVVAKDYYFHVEAPCDTSEGNECFTRSCDDYCPPNGLESYRVFKLPAAEYYRCIDNACSNICTTNGTICEEIKCSLETGDSCDIAL